MFGDLGEDEPGPGHGPGPRAEPSTNLSLPVLSPDDLNKVAETILYLFSPSVASDPIAAKRYQSELQHIQQSPEAWGLIAGLANHQDANVRFFSAHTAQVKISRDWETLPEPLRPALLNLLLSTLAEGLRPTNPLSHQAGNGIVVRKLFGSIASLLIRIAPYLFPSPILTVLQTIASSASQVPLPPSAPTSGYSTPGLYPTPTASTYLGGNLGTAEWEKVGYKMRLWSLEWLAICVEELGRAAVDVVKMNALRRHVETDMEAVMITIIGSLSPISGNGEERIKEAEAACACTESWVNWGVTGDHLTALLPHLYALLPLPAASSAISEILEESIFKYGKGTKVLTEPLLSWFTSSPGQAALGAPEGEPSDEVVGLTKLLAALTEHSSEWIVRRLDQGDVQALLRIILGLTGWEGTPGVDEQISELTLAIYPLIQEAIMDSEVFSEPHETSSAWGTAKSFFTELVSVTRRKVRWPGNGEAEAGGPLGGLDKDERENFESWRRDAGEVIVGAYYIRRDEMLSDLTRMAGDQVQSGGSWQDIEATLHCIRYAAEAVPLGEDKSLPELFGEQILGRLAQRSLHGTGEERLRLTVVSLIQAYEEWFKFHPDHLLPVLSYLVPSLTSTPAISRSAADALKALCDMCRKKLVAHIGAFSELHGKIGDLGPEEQTKVIQGISSVIQALNPADAIGPVESIVSPIVDRLLHALREYEAQPEATQPILVQVINALTACFKGLSPSDDEMFDLTEDEDDLATRAETVLRLRSDPRIEQLRIRIESGVQGLVAVWSGDGEIADAISSLIKHSTLSSDTLISLSPLFLLRLVTDAAQRSSSSLWLSLASTLTLRVNSPPSLLTQKRDKTPAEVEQHQREEQERWEVVADAASRLVGVAVGILGKEGGMVNNPDVVEAWFKFTSVVASRFPGVLLRLPNDIIEAYMSLGIMGLSAQERFSLKTATEFFTSLLTTTRFPSPLEPQADILLGHYGPEILRAILLSAGSEGPRSVIPNLAELLASFVTRISGQQMGEWLEVILNQKGFPDPRATVEAKSKLKAAVLRSRTTKKMREALHEFALVSRGLDGTTYGNATAV